MAYRLALANLGASGLGNEIVPQVETVGALSWSKVLNQPGACSFSCSERRADHAVLLPGAREVHLYRNEVLVWGGYLWTGQADQSGVVNFAAQGWSSRLKRRYLMVNKAYAGVDQLDIAWDLINYAQTVAGGGMGITRGSTARSGIKRDNAWYDYERNYIGDLLDSLASARDASPTFGDFGGFDYEVSPAKVWTTYFPSQSQTSSNSFALGVNIGQWTYAEDGIQVATAVTGVGGSVGGIKFFSPSQATELRATEFLPTYGLLQEAIARIDIKDQTFLDAKTKEWARIRRKVIPRPDITVVITEGDLDPTTLHVGDLCPVNLTTAGDPDAGLSTGWVNMNSTQRIVSLEVSVSQEGQETPHLGFAEPLSTTP